MKETKIISARKDVIVTKTVSRLEEKDFRKIKWNIFLLKLKTLLGLKNSPTMFICQVKISFKTFNGSERITEKGIIKVLAHTKEEAQVIACYKLQKELHVDFYNVEKDN